MDTTSGFSHKAIRQHTLGARLRALRTAQQLTRNEVAERSGVPVHHLAALEAERFSQLPPPVYVRAFLRALAPILRVHRKTLITLYERDMAVRGARTTSVTDGAPPRRRVRLYSAAVTPKRILMVVGVGIFLGALVYLGVMLRSFVGAPPLAVTVPHDNMKVETQTLTVSGLTDPSARVTLNGMEVVVGQDGRFETDVALAEGENTLVLQAVNRFDNVTTVERHVFVHLPPPPPAVEPTPPSLTVSVRRARTWLSITVDEERVLHETVPAGFTQTFHGEVVTITSGDGARTYVARGDQEPQPLSPNPGLISDVVFSLRDTPTATDDKTLDVPVSTPSEETVVE